MRLRVGSLVVVNKGASFGLAGCACFFFLFFFTRSPAVLVPLEAGEMRVLAGVSFGGLMLEAAASHWLLLAGWRALL